MIATPRWRISLHVGSEATTQPEAGNIYWFSFLDPTHPPIVKISLNTYFTRLEIRDQYSRPS
jgi:hypothetical protein